MFDSFVKFLSKDHLQVTNQNRGMTYIERALPASLKPDV